MLYPKKSIESKLGFDRIRALLKEECQGILGRKKVEDVKFSNDFEEIRKHVELTDEFLRLIISGEAPPASQFSDIYPYLKKAKITNNFLSEEEFYDLKISLTTLYQTLRVIKRQSVEEFPRLREMSKDIEMPYNILENIEQVIDENGQMRSNASQDLQDIRKQIIRTQVHLRKRIDGLLKKYKGDDYIREDVEPTVREGRIVLPVKSEHKRHLKGIVHDTSATGQTIFFEPEEVIDINNEIKELFYKEKREIIRILTQLTNDLRPYIDLLRYAYNFLAEVDFIRAKAQFARQIEACKPTLQKKPHIAWFGAFHPLLYLAYKEQNKKVVAYDKIQLNAENRILLISGPNAGGKSVLLKTVGLLQYMLQCGLLIPVSEGSEIGVFHSIFLDIGDEQSIDNDLSTYSSHLSNMKAFLQYASKSSLCLIDEFGTGTEPQFGAAIAEAILEKLNAQRVFGLITTHYANLKFLAEKSRHIQNGAMRFDIENLEPLFQLEIGKPGSSFALEIAQKIGLPKEVREQARIKLGEGQVNIENLLRDLEREKVQYERTNHELKQKQAHTEKLLEQYQQMKDEFERMRKQLLNQAKVEAQEVLRQANQKIEATIRQIKENKADKEVTQKARKALEDFVAEQQIHQVDTEALQEVGKEEYEVVKGEIEVGDFVRIKGQATTAEVLEIKQNDCLVRIGGLKSTVKRNRLEKISKKAAKKSEKQGTGSGIDWSAHAVKFSPNLDIRGKRAEEAVPIVAQFVEEAIMLNQDNLRIVHGKGTGALRQLVREQLRVYSEIKKVSDEHADRGGDGVTLIKLK
ncbi:MAG: endonuclease MutS2 [Bernardetiaceae bacterium]|nr:endonuclease MutS2 [Bernardetiaceae bacterium]